MNTVTTIEHSDMRIRAITRDGNPWSRNYLAKTRVYGAHDALNPELLAKMEEWTDTPVTAQLERDDPAEAKRIMRGYRSARRVLNTSTKSKIAVLLAAVADRFVGTATVESFSQNAGCSCGCSPGFILSEALLVGGKPVDLFISKIE